MGKKRVASAKQVEWNANVLRLTAFPSPGSSVDAVKWWSDVVGGSPDVKNLQPKIGGSNESGSFEGGRLILQVNPSRVDWIFVAKEDLEAGQEVMPVIGPFDSALGKFLPIVKRWTGVDTIPSLGRLAFGAVLLLAVKDRKSAYVTLSSYLHNVKINSEESTDLFYQINRPRDSKGKIRGLKINRLSKWSVLEVNIGIMTPPGPFVFGAAKENIVCQLELDINTAADFKGTINKGDIQNVFQELVDLGKEIAARGDIS